MLLGRNGSILYGPVCGRISGHERRSGGRRYAVLDGQQSLLLSGRLQFASFNRLIWQRCVVEWNVTTIKWPKRCALVCSAEVAIGRQMKWSAAGKKKSIGTAVGCGENLLLAALFKSRQINTARACRVHCQVARRLGSQMADFGRAHVDPSSPNRR